MNLMIMKASKLPIRNKVLLAPMAGVNDLAFRSMCWKYGSGLNFTEMVNVNAIERKNNATLKLAETLPGEKAAIQLFGTRVDALKKSVKILENDYDYIKPVMFNFNFGCPVKRIMNQGAGSALLRRPSKIGEIISAMRDSTDLPISAKIRLGITRKDANYLKTAKIVEESGADLLVVHARYQNQGYSGVAHWSAIKEIKDSVSIPVVGNGDIREEESAKRILDETGCDYIMIGRACMGNPFIFKRISSFLDSGKLLGQLDKYKLFEEYLKLAIKYKVKNSLIKMQALYFTKGLPRSTILRDRLRVCNDPMDISEIFKNHLDDIK